MDELRLAFRRLRKHPGASLASVLTLACATAAVAATYSIISVVLVRPLPVTDADRLVVVGTRIETGRDAGKLAEHHIYPDFPYLRDRGIFDRVMATGASGGVPIVEAGDVRARANTCYATYDLFDGLGVHIAAGRGFLPEEDRRGAPLAVILTDRYWRRTFGSDLTVVGRVIKINDKAATIVGVLPRGFRGTDLSQPPDLYLPLHTVADVGLSTINYFADTNTGYSPTSWVVIIGRLQSGSTLAGTSAALSSLPPAPGQRRAPAFGLTPINIAALPAATRDSMTAFTKLLGITAGLLLLIGCLTVGTLLLVRTEARRDEFAMCVALGASRGRLAFGIALEGSLLSIAGIALAIPLSAWLLNAVRAFQLPGGVDTGRLDIGIDAPAFVSAAACAVASTLLIAAVAGTFGFTANIADALRSRTGATPRVTRRRTRAALAATQVAVALVLVAGAGLFVRSTIAALSLNPGFETSRILTGGVSLPPEGYDASRAGVFFDMLQQRLAAHPSIKFVSMSGGNNVMGMGAHGRLTIDGESREMPSFVSFSAVDDRYFETMGIHLVAGRDFSQDDRASSPLVGVVSRSYGRFIANGGNPIGHRVTMGFRRPPAPPPEVQIVGVVPDIIKSVQDLEPFVLYLPMAQQSPGTWRTLVICLAGGACRPRAGAETGVSGLSEAAESLTKLNSEPRRPRSCYSTEQELLFNRKP